MKRRKYYRRAYQPIIEEVPLEYFLNKVVEVRGHYRPFQPDELDLFVHMHDDERRGMLIRVGTWTGIEAQVAVERFEKDRQRFWVLYKDRVTDELLKELGDIDPEEDN